MKIDAKCGICGRLDEDGVIFFSSAKKSNVSGVN
jgi:hypothetical protein